MNDKIAKVIDCIIFESGKVNYILPKNLISDLILLDKTAIFLKRSGLIVGRQKYQAKIVPIINLNLKSMGLLQNIHPKLLIIHLMHPNQSEILPIAILLDSDPVYLEINKNGIFQDKNILSAVLGTPVMVDGRNMVILDLAKITELILQSSNNS